MGWLASVSSHVHLPSPLDLRVGAEQAAPALQLDRLFDDIAAVHGHPDVARHLGRRRTGSRFFVILVVLGLDAVDRFRADVLGIRHAAQHVRAEQALGQLILLSSLENEMHWLLPVPRWFACTWCCRSARIPSRMSCVLSVESACSRSSASLAGRTNTLPPNSSRRFPSCRYSVDFHSASHLMR